MGAAAAGAPPATARLSLHEIAAHIATADASRFSCENAEQLRSMLNSPASALTCLRRILLKKGTPATQKIDPCVAALSHSAHSMREACERHLRDGGAAGAGGAATATAAAAAAGGGTAVSAQPAPILSGGVNPSLEGGAAAATGPGAVVAPGGESGLYCLCQQVPACHSFP